MCDCSGWVSIHRKINDNILWTDKQPFDKRSAWIDLLLMVNRHPNEIMVDGCPLMIHRGQRFTSIRKLGEKWHWSKDRVRRYLELLQKSGMAQYCATHGGTLVTIMNYDFYQHVSDTEQDTAGTSSGTTSGRGRDASTTQTIKSNNEDTDNKENKRDGAPRLNPQGVPYE